MIARVLIAGIASAVGVLALIGTASVFLPRLDGLLEQRAIAIVDSVVALPTMLLLTLIVGLIAVIASMQPA